MGLSTSTVFATEADRGLAPTPALEPLGPGTAVHAGTRNPGHPVFAHRPTGARERVAVSEGGAP
ncbi:hypothetical protein FBY22_3998 [Streptomyces sp. SLBN-31]|nr:hypothetical protein FBY22_3998 [Streptomyces sp. SLBN-31]